MAVTWSALAFVAANGMLQIRGVGLCECNYKPGAAAEEAEGIGACTHGSFRGQGKCSRLFISWLSSSVECLLHKGETHDGQELVPVARETDGLFPPARSDLLLGKTAGCRILVDIPQMSRRGAISCP